MLYAADDKESINAAIEYERGISAAAIGSPRDAPSVCADRVKWYAGYDEAKRLMALAA